MMLEAAFAILAVILLVCHLRGPGKKAQLTSVPLPPTLRRMPLLGSLPWMFGRRIYELVAQHDKNHTPRPIVYLQLGNRKSVFINDLRMVRQVFLEASAHTSDRPYLPVFDIHNRDRLGIVSAPNHRWVANRRFALRVLRQFGFGKAHVIDKLIAGEMALFRAKIDAQLGCPVSPAPLCNRLVGGVICNLLFGHSLDEGSNWFDSLLHDTNVFLQDPYLLMLFFPWCKHLYRLPVISRFLPSKQAVDSGTRLSEFMANMVAEVRSSLAHDNTRSPSTASNFAEAYLLDPSNPSNEEGGKMASPAVVDAHLTRLLTEFFLAGVDTTAITIEWGLLLLSLHPEVQERAHAEIETLVGGHKNLDYHHATQLPFTKAVVNEVLRYGCVASVSIPHTTTKDLEVTADGERWRIPAGCYLHANIFALSRSHEHWSDPDGFDPAANFMDASEQSFQCPEAFLPFSLGRRVCPGESLARNELFVAMASIIQTYRVRLADNYAALPKETLLETSRSGFVRSPKHIDLVFERWM